MKEELWGVRKGGGWGRERSKGERERARARIQLSEREDANGLSGRGSSGSHYVSFTPFVTEWPAAMWALVWALIREREWERERDRCQAWGASSVKASVTVSVPLMHYQRASVCVVRIYGSSETLHVYRLWNRVLSGNCCHGEQSTGYSSSWMSAFRYLCVCFAQPECVGVWGMFEM